MHHVHSFSMFFLVICHPFLITPACDPVQLNNSPLQCLLYADDLIIMSESASGSYQSTSVRLRL